MEQQLDIWKTKNLGVSQKPYFIIYEVTLKRIAQPKQLVKDLTLVMVKVEVPCIFQFTGEIKFVSILKEQLNLLKKNQCISLRFCFYFSSVVWAIGEYSPRGLLKWFNLFLWKSVTKGSTEI